MLKKLEKLKNDVYCRFCWIYCDALTLFERLEAKLEKHAGNLPRAAVELAKDWRTDKYLKKIRSFNGCGR